MANDSSERARKFIDASLAARGGKGGSIRPSKAAYARAVRLARKAIEELTLVARRAQQSTSR